MIKARLDTTNFCFEAYGSTIAGARAALIDGLKTHARQYGIDTDWWSECQGDIYTTPIQLNRAYRDDEPIREKA